MGTRKSINISDSANNNGPFSITTFLSEDGKKTQFSASSRSVIYKSFNLKDIMVDEGFIDKKTQELIKEKEKNLDRHIIKDLSKAQEAYPDSIIYLDIKISPNLNIKSAELLSGPIDVGGTPTGEDPPWEGFPELIGFKPPLEFDEKGQLKNIFVSRYQERAYVPVAYITSDPAVNGKSVSFITEKETITQTLVQILNTNIIIQTFNYDGIPVAYPIPFFGGTYLYYDFAKTE